MRDRTQQKSNCTVRDLPSALSVCGWRVYVSDCDNRTIAQENDAGMIEVGRYAAQLLGFVEKNEVRHGQWGNLHIITSHILYEHDKPLSEVGRVSVSEPILHQTVFNTLIPRLREYVINNIDVIITIIYSHKYVYCCCFLVIELHEYL